MSEQSRDRVEEIRERIERERAVVEEHGQDDPPWMGGYSSALSWVMDLIEGKGEIKSQEQEYEERAERLRQYDLEDAMRDES